MRRLSAAALLLAAASCHADDFLYVVRPGDNPWNVTERYLLGITYWPKIQRLNHIADPIHIKPGTVLRIPTEWLRLIATEVRLTAWSGDVSWSGADGVANAPVAGTALKSGARIRTGSNASATLAFEDGSRVLVLSDSELSVTQSARYATGGPVVQLQLVRGNIENLVTPRKDQPGRFEIHTPAAVAAVRGTEFRVGADASEARSEVLVGIVDLGNASGHQGLQQGFGSRAATDRAPTVPKKLLPAPDLAAAPRIVERVPFEAAIAPLANASAYRSQLAPDRAFTTVYSNRVIDTPKLAIVDVPDGDYIVRVRGIDANGLEGFSADRAITIHARPEPPVLIDPPSDAQLAAERPTLRWTAVAQAAHYRAQLSRSPAFDTLFVDAPMLDATALETPATLEPGPYYWRVATIETTIGQGPFSDPQAFRRVLPAPGVELPALTGDPLDLRWRNMGTGVSYHVQLARDQSFQDLLVDTVVDNAQYPLKKPSAGNYYLRVASVSADGYTGPWGSVQTLAIPDSSTPLWPLLLFLIPLFL
jgi:hypothetical protein